MLDRLMAYRAWANRLLLGWCVRVISDEAYCVKMGSHILLGEAVWLERLRGLPTTVEAWDSLPADQWIAHLDKNEIGWAETLRSDVSRQIHYRRRDGRESESALYDLLMHVCIHSAYHRGQIAAQANRLDLHPPATDFIVFARSFPDASAFSQASSREHLADAAQPSQRPSQPAVPGM